MKKIGLYLLSSALLVAAGFTLARAETVVCTVIDSLPYTITTQGVYCLTGHLSTSMSSGCAISINTNNVVLDLNGFKLGGLGAGVGTATDGICAYQRQNITIKNGTIRGFLRGISIEDTTPFTVSQGHMIEDIRADQNTYQGILIGGRGNTIRNNQVVATGGSTPFISLDADGIATYGEAAQVLNNLVTRVTPQTYGTSYGIRLVEASGSVVAGNRVSKIIYINGNSVGIYVESGLGIHVRDNTLSYTAVGIAYASGSSGKYMNNLSGNDINSYSGGTAAGTTNY